jgi:hypothetical protein
MFTRVKPLGWALYEELTSAQMNQIDLNLSRAVDGYDGGTYTLNNPITFNGTVNMSGSNNWTGAIVSDTSFTSNGTSTVLNTTSTNIYSTFVNVQSGVAFDFLAGSNVYVRGGFNFMGSSTVNFQSGAGVEFNASTDFKAVNVFTSTSSIDVRGGFTVDAGATAVFNSNALFNEGLELPIGKKIKYSTPETWTVSLSFGAGVPESMDNTVFQYHSSDLVVRQIDNSGSNTRWFLFPQGLTGGTPTDLIGVIARTSSFGISGTTPNPTEFVLYIKDSAGTTVNSVSFVDTNPHASSAHNVAPAAPFSFPYNPSIHHLVIEFKGYGGSDTLNAFNKWYELRALLLVFQTDAKGVY